MNSPALNSTDNFNPLDHWDLAEGVTYLNHGSFGPSPKCVRKSRQAWSEKLERQPMDFFLQQMETALDEAEEKLGKFVGTDRKNVVFMDNATAGMNIVADSTPLQKDDEVLLTDHEYGAVSRIWRRACRNVGAKVITAKLPFPLTTPEAVTSAVMDEVNDRTRMIVVSHVTSPTALTLPVAEICRRARGARVPVCVDGPHAVAMLPINLKEIGCDYYTASCHKWLSGPFGTGFLYAAPRRQSSLKPAVMSWGGSLNGRDPHWKDEYRWIGTRDPAVYLAVPDAIDFLQSYGLENFRKQTHQLARLFRERMTELTGLEPFVPDSEEWFGPMTTVPLPALKEAPPKQGWTDPLQTALRDQYQIEIPVVHWQGHRLLRVSCHLYNTPADIDTLFNALKKLLAVPQ